MLKIIMIMSIVGACRRDELTKITVNDLNKQGEVLIVNIPDSKTHTSTKCVLVGRDQEYLEKYLRLRPPHVTSNKLFLYYKKGKCTSQVVGINSIGKVPIQIASSLNLQDPGSYAGHCFRRSSATLLANAGGDLMTLKHHGGWQSSTVAEGYVDDSIENKVVVANKITGVERSIQLQQSTPSCSNPKVIVQSSVHETLSEIPYIKIANISNSIVTININK